MPGIIPPGGAGGVGPSGDPQVTFANSVASQTGLDPRVVYAWTVAEGANAPGGTGHFNFLNLRPYPGDPFYAVSPGGFEQFSSVDNAIAATVRRINQPFASGIRASSGGTPASQITAISASQWDAGHYRSGGVIGKALMDVFSRLYGSGAAGKPSEKGSLPAAGGGASGDQTSAASALGALDPSAWFRDIFGISVLQMLEVVAGSVLVLLGLWLLVKQVGLAAGVNVPSPVEVASATIPGAPAQKAARAAQTRSTAATQAVQVRESRAAELHTSRVKLNQARATELRTRTRHRRRTKQEQNKELDRAYIRGAADTSPLGG